MDDRNPRNNRQPPADVGVGVPYSSISKTKTIAHKRVCVKLLRAQKYVL